MDLTHHASERTGVAFAGLRHVAMRDWSTMGAWAQAAAHLAVVEHAMQMADERVSDAAYDEPGRAQP